MALPPPSRPDCAVDSAAVLPIFAASFPGMWILNGVTLVRAEWSVADGTTGATVLSARIE